MYTELLPKCHSYQANEACIGGSGSQLHPKHGGWEGSSAAIAVQLMGTAGEILA